MVTRYAKAIAATIPSVGVFLAVVVVQFGGDPLGALAIAGLFAAVGVAAVWAVPND